MKCLVTGGAGFIGCHLVRALLKGGHKVTIIDNLSNADRVPDEFIDRTTVHLDDVRRICSFSFKVDVVFHLAAVSRTPHAVDDPVRCIKTNINGTQAVLELAKLNNIPRVVVASSNVVYAGDTPYRVSKLAAEMLCSTYNELYGTSVIPLRFSNVYGPGFRHGDVAVFASLRDSYLKKGYVEVTGDGRQTRDYSHVSDVVAAMLLAWKSQSKGPLDICTGINTRLVDAIKLMGDAISTKMEIRFVPPRVGDVMNIFQNPHVAFNEIGYRATVPLAEGIRDVWKD